VYPYLRAGLLFKIVTNVLPTAMKLVFTAPQDSRIKVMVLWSHFVLSMHVV